MTSEEPVTLCRYFYDALDRLASNAPAGLDSVLRFYQKNRLTTQIHGLIQSSLLHADDHLLGWHEKTGSAILATDHQNSVMASQAQTFTYTPYGIRHSSIDPMSLPGFTGQPVEPVTGHYLLGNGYRAFNPVLMRFNSPDNLSPFGKGGLNAYAYCTGDPVNRIDPEGEWGVKEMILRNVTRSPVNRSSAPINQPSSPVNRRSISPPRRTASRTQELELFLNSPHSARRGAFSRSVADTYATQPSINRNTNPVGSVNQPRREPTASRTHASDTTNAGTRRRTIPRTPTASSSTPDTVPDRAVIQAESITLQDMQYTRVTIEVPNNMDALAMIRSGPDNQPDVQVGFRHRPRQ
ncbi:RHS repeat-associated core domain-containing protein [Pseudomonas floridensis]|uniref:RHS repeat-associated core domain-containing protein n=1 Tax=Pseudomonas floridensis TaxID=1958950 RepID=UPI0009F56ADD|nr:RHS repeat-associated core domain-containing protein [Pseudomonas floridensis]